MDTLTEPKIVEMNMIAIIKYFSISSAAIDPVINGSPDIFAPAAKISAVMKDTGAISKSI